MGMSLNYTSRKLLSTLPALITVCAILNAALAQEQKPAEPLPSPTPEKADPDQSDLAERLMRKAVAESDESLMAGIVRRMAEAAKKLELHFDAGEPTQRVQQEISEKLDEAIKIAATQRKPGKQPSQSSGADKRRMPSKPRPEQGKGAVQRGGQTAEPSNESTTTSASVATEKQRGELLDARRGWGQLPQREREEVIQGSNEGYLDRYRQWVERYYRTLQGSDE